MNKLKLLIAMLIVSPLYAADNEIYIDQSGSTANIDLEQLGNSNIIGGLNSVAGTLTALDLDGLNLTLDINQIGNTNKFLGDILGDSITGFFEFDGDSNTFTIQADPTDTYGVDSSDYNVDVTGSSNVFDIDLAELSAADYADLDLIVLGDSNDLTWDIDSEYYTAYVDIFGDSNTMTLTKSGYGASSSDGGYFYLDLNGDSNTLSIQQKSTLAADWLKIESDASNSNICVIQNDGGTSTSC